MNAIAIVSLGCALLAAPVYGQGLISLNRLPSGAAPSLNQSDRHVPERTLQNTLVAVDTRHDGARKKLGVSLTTPSSPFELAYDPSGNNLMAQWRSVYTTAAGQSFQYQAFVGESGTINFVLSSKF